MEQTGQNFHIFKSHRSMVNHIHARKKLWDKVKKLCPTLSHLSHINMNKTFSVYHKYLNIPYYLYYSNPKP